MLWIAARNHSTFGMSIFMILWPLAIFTLSPKLTIATKPNVIKAKTICFDETGSHHAGDGYSFDRPWSSYRSCLLFENIVILRYGLGNASILKASDFDSSDYFNTFLSLVSDHLGDIRRK